MKGVTSRELRSSAINAKTAANLHVYPAPIVNAGRILKETESIVDAGLFDEVVVCGTASPELPSIEIIDAKRRIERVGRPEKQRPRNVVARILSQIAWSVAVYRRYSRSNVTLVNAHSVAVLPVCYLLSRRLGARLVYDTHELETETIASRGAQGKIFKTIERSLIGRCDLVFVVNESIARWYADAYPGLTPIAVRNIPVIHGTAAVPSLRDTLGIPSSALLFIHVGHITAGRNVEAILDAFASESETNHVVFLGAGVLGPLVDSFAESHANIHHVGAVASNEVVAYAATADVGLCLIQPSCLSYKYSLPNKAMEYTFAGVPFLYTDLPEVSAMLGTLQESWMVPNVETDLPDAIASVSPERIMAARAAIAALRIPTWHDEAAGMISAYESLLESRTRS